ncbi:MAG: MAB_1171c family putative transporter [Mycobacterium sp.]
MTSVFDDSAAAYAVAAVFSFGAVLVVAAAMLRSRVRPPASVALLMSFLFKGIAVTLATPPVYEKFDSLTGVHNMGRLVLNLSGGMAWTACVLIVITFWGESGPRAVQRTRVWVGMAVAIGGALILCWIVAPPSELPPDFYSAHGAKPAWVLYMLIYLITYGLGALLIIVKCLQYARFHDVAWLRRSMLLTAAGATMCLLFCIMRAHSAIYGMITNDSYSWQRLAPLAATVGQILIVIGLAGPSFSLLVSSARQRIQTYRSHRQLEPLWTALYEGNTQIALAPPKAAVGDHNYRLYRRIVEIRDGLSAIRPYLAEDSSTTSAARQIHAAIEQQRMAPQNDKSSATKIIGEHPGADRKEELSWLLDVARELEKITRRRTPEANPPVPPLVSAQAASSKPAQSRG